MNSHLPRAGLALAAALLLGACGGPKPDAGSTVSPPAGASAVQTDAEKILNVYNWSDYIDDVVVKEFEAEYGIKVNYDVFDSNEVVETKLLAGNTGYDIVVPSASFLERQITAGVFQPLDTALLPNLKNLDPDITQRVALHDPGNKYSVNYLWGTSGVGYNVEMINQRMPDAPTDSWRMFYDPAVVSKFADCGVAILDAPSEVVGTVLILLGKEANSEDPADLQAAEDVLMKIRPSIRYVNSSKYIDDLANGEICLALGWVGDVLQARDRADEAGKGNTIRYSLPKEGAIMFFDMLAIPKDAKHPLNAHLFIDFLLRPEIAARNSSYVNYANSNVASYALVDEAVRNDPSIYPSAEVMTRLVPDLAETPEFTRLLTRSWTRFKTGR
ncbi:MAG: polyamine ABC transporter substrate-binding protein [Gammaproteobacteria bacterium]|nr:polyamine ABC transporter substrate-binding protein [Gammaproteobacteria bacterium]